MVVAAVAVGAFAAATAGQTLQAGESGDSPDVAPIADSTDASAAIGIGGDGGNSVSAAAPEILTVARTSPVAPLEAQKILATDRIVQARAARLAAIEAEKNRPKFVRPADGRLTSGYGARWGTTHYGMDIANRIGTPILAAADGVVIEAGTASGFGLWVRVEHTDGTVSVYGHVDTYSVSVGEEVKAGDQIARMGNRGYSTGPHLHFEIWDASGLKMDPMSWLTEHGVYY